MATFKRVSGNFEYWLAHGMLPLGRYRPEVETLRSGTPRIVIGLGAASTGQPIAAMGISAAKALGTDPVVFPGDHVGFASHTAEFVETLDRILRGNYPSAPR